jgi:type I restriction enzyme, S subunit
MLNLSNSALKNLPIPLPPLDEQKRIVAILDEAFEGLDRAAANAKKNLANARELLEIGTQKLFRQCDEAGYSLAKVQDLAEQRKGAIRTGPFGSQLLHSEFVDTGIAVLGIDNVVDNKFGWRRLRFVTPEKYKQLVRYTVNPGDVLISIMGTCGRCAVVPDDIPLAINTKHLCCITVDRKKCKSEYLRATCKIAAARGIFRSDGGDEARRPRRESGMVLL